MTTPYWLLGIPFDVVNLSQVRAKIFAAADSQQQLIFATPNVSFLAQADRDTRFREDILHTGLSLADGMPVVWLGRLLGVPFTERVAGSDVLQSLIVDAGPRRLRVFFFGGDKGVAEEAMQAVNRHGGGLVAVGAYYPGFVSVEQMSSEAVIGMINDSNADLLIVALGAAKGHRWIEENRHRLKAPVISHLGAAINFVAGRLQRAPRFIQRAGLEWLWRIKEEPALIKRYTQDGWFLMRLIAGFVLPEVLRRKARTKISPSLDVTRSENGTLTISVTQRFGTEEAGTLHLAAAQRPRDAGVAVNLRLVGVTQLDALSVGSLYANQYRPAGTTMFKLICDPVSRAALKRWRADFMAAPEQC